MTLGTAGTLIQCDEACMATVERLNRQVEKETGKGFIIIRIDSTHCLVHSDKSDEIKREVKERMDKAMGKDVEEDDIDSDLDEVSKYVTKRQYENYIAQQS